MSWGEEPTPDVGRDDASDQGQGPPPSRLRPLNLGDVLDGTFRLLRDHWRAFAIGLGVVVVPLALLSGLVATLMFGTQPGFFEMMQDPTAVQTWIEGEPPEDFGALAAALGLSGLANFLLTPLLYGTSVHIAATGYRSRHVDPMASLRVAGRRYFGLLGTSVLLFVVPLLIFLAPLLLVIVGSVTGADGLSLIGGLGFIVSAVVALIAIVRLLLAIPALMIERVGPMQALRRSNTLVKGKTGIVLGTAVVVYIITVIIGLVLAFPFQAAGGAVGATVGAVATTVGQMVSSLVTDALLGAALVLIYFDRRVRTEGYDLTELAGELGAPQDPSL